VAAKRALDPRPSIAGEQLPGVRVRDYPLTLDKLIDRLPPVA
jgi:hypothetical protein